LNGGIASEMDPIEIFKTVGLIVAALYGIFLAFGAHKVAELAERTHMFLGRVVAFLVLGIAVTPTFHNSLHCPTPNPFPSNLLATPTPAVFHCTGSLFTKPSGFIHGYLIPTLIDLVESFVAIGVAFAVAWITIWLIRQLRRSNEGDSVR
jgi:hypothetical protein